MVASEQRRHRPDRRSGRSATNRRQPGRLAAQAACGAAPRPATRHRRGDAADARRRPAVGSAGGLLEDHVRVGAADAERRHRRPARPIRRRPRHAPRSAAAPRPPTSPRAATARPRAGSAAARRAASPCTILITPATRRRLGVPDVRLHRPQPQRPVRRPVLPVGRQQRLRLDRVAQRRARTVRLHHVDLGRPTARRWPAPAGSPAAATDRSARSARCDAPSWFTAVPRTTASTWCPLRRASDSRSTSSTPTPSAQPVPSAAAGERLAPAVRRQPALPAELDERAPASPSPSRRRPAPGALARPQRLHRQVQRHQRRRARRVHRHRRALQARTCTPPGRRRRCRSAGAEVALEPPAPSQPRCRSRGTSPRRRRRCGCPRSEPRVDARPARTPPRTSPAAAAAAGPSPAPRAGEIPKNPGSNSAGVVQEPALAGRSVVPGWSRVRVVQRARGPSPGRSGSPAIASPPAATSCHSSSGEPTPPGIPAGHADDRDRLVGGGRGAAAARSPASAGAGQLGSSRCSASAAGVG